MVPVERFTGVKFAYRDRTLRPAYYIRPPAKAGMPQPMEYRY